MDVVGDPGPVSWIRRHWGSGRRSCAALGRGGQGATLGVATHFRMCAATERPACRCDVPGCALGAFRRTARRRPCSIRAAPERNAPTQTHSLCASTGYLVKCRLKNAFLIAVRTRPCQLVIFNTEHLPPNPDSLPCRVRTRSSAVTNALRHPNPSPSTWRMFPRPSLSAARWAKLGLALVLALVLLAALAASLGAWPASTTRDALERAQPAAEPGRLLRFLPAEPSYRIGDAPPALPRSPVTAAGAPALSSSSAQPNPAAPKRSWRVREVLVRTEECQVKESAQVPIGTQGFQAACNADCVQMELEDLWQLISTQSGPEIPRSPPRCPQCSRTTATSTMSSICTMC